MLKMKYIIVDHEILGVVPIMFGSSLRHDLFWHRSEIIGAGFVEIGDQTVFCYGESESLKIKSRGEEDERVIMRWFEIRA